MSHLTLYLVRHGESVSNFNNVFIGRSVDPALTETGLQQARSLAESLRGKKVAAIFSSTLLRARQTAQIVADEVGLPVTHSKDLIEVGLGLLDGHDIGDPAFLSVYKNMVANWESGYPQVCVPEGESLLDVKARLECFLNENVFNRNWDGAVLLVGHAILWMSFIWAFCENQPPRINDGFMSKTHLSIISKNGKGYVLDHCNLNHEETTGLKNLH
ncbi:MAG: histidine phosphatase family protein [Pelolinea sp.]|nr:histidine phosphatase family protein [Pelolinea sp.]